MRGQLPVHARVRRSELRREADAFGWLRHGAQRPLLDAVEGRDQELRAIGGEPAEQVTRGVGWPDRFGDHAEDRSGVKLGDEPECRGAGDVVPVQDRVLHRRGTAPGGQ